MTCWDDTIVIYPPDPHISGALAEDSPALLVGVLVQTPVPRTTTVGPLSFVQIKTEVTFTLSMSNLANTVNCVAWGTLATNIGDLTAGTRLRVVGQFQPLLQRVAVDAAGVEDANIIL
jgi:hypothetical protein